LEYQWRQLSTYLSASYQSESFQGPYASRSYLGGYTLWGLGAAYPLSSKLTVRANIDNLLDKNYQSSDGYNTAGLTFGLNLNYRAF
jgi:vitamin B12 transporter